MKRFLLVISLVIVLVGSLAGGLALNAGAANPSLKITKFNGIVPASIIVSGQNWNPSESPINFYVDVEDEQHRVGELVQDSSRGTFVKNLPLGSLSIGRHRLIAEGSTGLRVDIEFYVTARELANEHTLETLTNIEDNVLGFESTRGSRKCSESGFDEVFFPYRSIRHVNLSLMTKNLDGGDEVNVRIHFGPRGEEVQYVSDYDLIANITSNGVQFFQFDTDQWGLESIDWSGNNSLEFFWEVTTIGRIEPAS